MVTIRNRAYWNARTPRSRSTISVPVAENWLHHTAGSEAGAEGMRRIQNYHMDTKGWSDIGYSWVYDKDERVWYEGRGWGVSGAHTYGHNSVSHGFCVMGNFNNEIVTDEMIADIAWMVARGHELGKGPAELTGGHRDTKSTSCPGDNLYDSIPLINNKISEGGTDVPQRQDNVLEVGDRGNAVAGFQRCVLAWADDAGHEGRTWTAARTKGDDGVFDENTEAIVKAYQSASHLVATGKVDGTTAALLSRYITHEVEDTTHTHSEYAAKSHGHDYAAKGHEHAPDVHEHDYAASDHGHDAGAHSHQLTFQID